MKKLLGESGVVHILPLVLIIAAVGVISFLLISSTAPSGGLFGKLNPKPASHAANPAITVPLKQSTINPHYFVDGNGKAVLLTGSHTWNNFQDWGTNGQPQTLDFNAYVNMLKTYNHNFTLLWTTELPTFCNFPSIGNGNPAFTVSTFPWQRTGPGTANDGKPKFDLTKFDQTFFDRLRSRVQILNDNGIYAGVYAFTGEWLNLFRCADGYPFSSSNNINGISDGGGNGSIFMTAPNAITAIQDTYVEKLVDTLNDLPNVLWGTSEESPPESDWWNRRQIDHIKAYEATKPFKHPVGYGTYINTGDQQMATTNVDWMAPLSRISGSSSCGSGTPSCKVNINDSDHGYFGLWNDSAQVNRNYVWENFTQGSQVLFMDPYIVYYPRDNRNPCPNPVNGICSAPDPKYNGLRANMGYTRSYADRMNLIAMTPQGNRTSTTWALANTSATAPEYLVYAPNGGSFTVNLSGSSKSLAVEWFNPSTGVKTMGANVTAGSTQSFTPPFSGDAVLYLVDSGGQGTPPPTQPPTPTPTPSPTPVPGTPTLIQSNSLDSSGTSVTVSYNGNVTSGDLLVAAIRIGTSTATATVTDNNGNNWARVDRQADAGTGGGNELELWYAANAKNSPNARPTVTVSSNVSATIRVVLEEFNNILTVNPLDQHAVAAGNNDMAMVTSGSTTQANELAISYAETENGSTYAPFGGYTIDKTVASKLITMYRPLTTTGVQVPMFTITPQNWAMGVATFKASSTTSSPTPTPTSSPIPACLKGPMGDTDCDGDIDIFDYNQVLTDYGKTGSGILGDVNDDLIVDIFDYNEILTNYGK